MAKPNRSMLAAIGEVANESARVDEQLREVFTLLIESPCGEVISAGEDTGRLVQLCLRVAGFNRRVPDEAVEFLRTVCQYIDQLRLDRNFLIHSVWEKIPGSTEHVGIRSKRPATSGRTETSEAFRWTLEQALDTAEAYRVVSQSLGQFIDGVFPGERKPRVISRHRWAEMTDAMNKLSALLMPPAARDPACDG